MIPPQPLHLTREPPKTQRHLLCKAHHVHNRTALAAGFNCLARQQEAGRHDFAKP